MTNKKQAMGREFFSLPTLQYRKELVDLGGSSLWVREPSTYALSLFKEQGDELALEYNESKLSKEEYVDKANTISARLVIACVCDENGDLLGDESNLEAIKNMPNRVINKIIAKVFDLSGVPYKEVDEVAANLKKEGLV